jgi:hypothetical protein
LILLKDDYDTIVEYEDELEEPDEIDPEEE